MPTTRAILYHLVIIHSSFLHMHIFAHSQRDSACSRNHLDFRHLECS